MNKKHYLWYRQFVEMTKELSRVYDQFYSSREIEHFDKAEKIHEEINNLYKKSIDLLDYVNFGRARLERDSPQNKELI